MQSKTIKIFVLIVFVFLCYNGHTFIDYTYKQKSGISVKPIKNHSNTIANTDIGLTDIDDAIAYGKGCDTCFNVTSGIVFSGGSGDGFATTETGNVCSYPSFNVNFYGGNGDGFAMDNLGVICVSPAFNANFSGGSGDGFAMDDFGTICASPAFNANFSGGSGDGFAFVNLRDDCLPPGPVQNFIFSGGSGDGFAMNDFGTICVYPSFNTNFSGGSGDGFAFINLRDDCLPLGPGQNFIFAGGSGDGFAMDDFGTICVYPSFNRTFYGGNGDGFAMDDFGTICIYPSFNRTFYGGNGDGFSTWAYLSSDPITCLPLNPLPIELLYFNATRESDKVRTEWITLSERDNDYFTVERTLDGTNWKSIGEIPGAGNSSSQLNYELYDTEPETGILYYRLKQTDFDGQFTYSQIRSVIFDDNQNSAISLFPNPTDGTLNMTIAGEKLTDANIQLFSAAGQLVYELTNFTGAEHSFNLSKYQSGVYLLKVQSKNDFYIFKIVKE